MNDDKRKEIEQKTEESKQQAIQEAKEDDNNNNDGDKTIHTINPFTGAQMNITPGDLEGIEKKHEADTERD